MTGVWRMAPEQGMDCMEQECAHKQACTMRLHGGFATGTCREHDASPFATCRAEQASGAG